MRRATFNPEEWLTPNCYSAKTFGKPPAGPGVYLFVRVTVKYEPRRIKYRVLYAGMSRNVKRRVLTHDIKNILYEKYGISDVQLFFKPTEIELLRAAERELITKFNPPYNIQGRRRGA